MNNKRRYYKTEERAIQVLNILKQNNPSLAEKLSVKFDRTDGYYLGRTHYCGFNAKSISNVRTDLNIAKKLKQLDINYD